jgi:hypothetical protein
MEFSEFMELTKLGISKVGKYPDGLTYLKLKDGTEMLYNQGIFDSMTTKDLGPYIVGLSSFCDKIYTLGSLYTESLIAPNLDKQSNGKPANQYCSFFEIDCSLCPSEFMHEQEGVFDYSQIKIFEKVHTYNSENSSIIHAPLLTDIHTEVVRCGVAQEFVFVKHWKRIKKKIDDESLNSLSSNRPFGDNRILEGLTAKKIVKNHYENYYNSMKTIIEKQLRNIKRKIESSEGFGTFSVDEFKEGIENLGEIENFKNKINETDNKDNDESNKKNKKSTESLQDRIRRRINDRNKRE